MKERPILFTVSMIMAILAGRKIMTRRVLKNLDGVWRFISENHSKEEPCKAFIQDEYGDYFSMPCPYGQPGDLLYVKEAWRTGKKLDGMNATDIMKAAQEVGYKQGPYCPLWYPSDGSYRQWGDHDVHDFGFPGRKRSSRFMPKWAARIILEVTAVRVERLQEITEEDAKSEGVTPSIVGYDLGSAQYRAGFQTLWDSINGKKIPWEHNPWVWVVSFQKIASRR